MSILTFDIGGSFIKYAWMEENGTILKSNKVKTPTENLESFYGAIKEVYEEHPDKISGIAVSMPGIIDVETGYIHHGGALQFNSDRNFFDDIKSHLSLNDDLLISVENDAYCAALAEVWLGNLKDVEDGVVILLGTGVGGALIKDGKLHKGANMFAGEFSFTLNKDVLTKGIQEAFGVKASVPMFANRVAKAKGLESLDGIEAYELINSGDPQALEIFNDYVMELGTFIFNLQAFYDPERILIGGAVSSQPILLKSLQEFLDGIYKMIPIKMPKTDLNTCRHFNDSNLYGALYHYLVINGIMQEEVKNPK